jgi:hypothetical protein
VFRRVITVAKFNRQVFSLDVPELTKDSRIALTYGVRLASVEL